MKLITESDPKALSGLQLRYEESDRLASVHFQTLGSAPNLKSQSKRAESKLERSGTGNASVHFYGDSI